MVIWNEMLFLLVALGAAGVGIAGTLTAVMRIPPSQKSEEPLLTWDEKPPPDFLLDPLSVLFILLDGLIMIAIGFLLLQSVSRPVHYPIPELSADRHMGLLSFLIGGGSLAIVFFFCGNLVTILARALTSRRRSRSILPQGVRIGPFFLAWNQFGRFTADPSSGTIQFYSRYCPKIRSLVLNPPDPDRARQAIELIGRSLPNQDQPTDIPWHHSRAALISGFVSLSGIFLLAGIALAKIQAEWAWFGMAALAIAFSWLRRKLVSIFYFSGNPGNPK